MKKLISCFLLATISLSLSTNALANTVTNSAIIAKAAIVTNVDETGSNLTNDKTTEDNVVYTDLDIVISHANQTSLQVDTIINGNTVSIVGTPLGHSENEKALFFSAVSSNPRYEVIHFAYVDGTETNMYFKNHSQNTDATSILKIYLRDTLSSTRDYIMIECFEYNLQEFDYYIQNLPTDALAGVWAPKEFTALDQAPIDPIYINEDTYTFYDTFHNMGTLETHYVTLLSNATYDNVEANGFGNIDYKLTLKAKGFESNDPSHQSSTSSALHVTNVELRQATIPNVGFHAVEIDGDVSKNGWFGNLSANISFGYGPLSLSLSTPSLFPENGGSIDINEVFDSYTNSPTYNEFTRYSCVEMDSDYFLSKINDEFVVMHELIDLGGSTQAAKTHYATWCFTVENWASLEDNDYSKPHNVAMRITT